MAPMLVADAYGKVWGLITLALCVVLGVGLIALSYWSHKKEQKTDKGLYFVVEVVSGVIGGFLLFFNCVPPIW